MVTKKQSSSSPSANSIATKKVTKTVTQSAQKDTATATVAKQQVAQQKKNNTVKKPVKEIIKQPPQEEDEEEQQEEQQEKNEKSKQPMKKAKFDEDDDEEEITESSTTGKGITNSGDKKIENVTFESLGVHPQIADACTRLGFKEPKEIQREVIPWAIKGRDIIGLAQTGSGKTAAFVIPVLQRLLDQPQAFFGLALAPTRELAFQIAEQFTALGSIIGVRCSVLVGGIDAMTQSISLAKKPHIVVGTPGRVIYHLENTKGFNLRSIKYFIMDEADRLFNQDFEEEINKILTVIPKDRNTFLFSATMTSKVAKLQRASLSNPVKVQVATKYQTVDTLLQQYCFIPHKYKDVYLTYILNELAGNLTIVFCSTCASSTKLALMLRNLGLGAIPINGDMDQTKRLASLNKFKQGQKSILVATDVAARGLDIPSVDLVINYDVPSNSKEYIHRVGRTARAGNSGRSITLVTQYDLEMYLRIEHVLEKKLDQFQAQEETVLILLERVNEALRLATNEIKDKGYQSKEGRSDDSENTTGTSIKKVNVVKKVQKKKKY
ncbi:hypothetical protein CYY_000462 [Polysphondylium violaceum]|uniref:RNA helicase n=1 Tax=Polysphondylium violaceum TaxID=133409 RepID=A0A8J4V8Y8_9MYCE|nr:hypothetical protein CYY_000462 [Polysphondylium violaceum]